MKKQIRTVGAGLALALGTLVILSGLSAPAAAIDLPRRDIRTVVIHGTGLNGSAVTTTIRYTNGTPTCATVVERVTGQPPRTVANSCPVLPRR